MAHSRAALRLTGILASYGRFHRDRRNRLTHYLGVPAIIYSILVALALHSNMVGGAAPRLDRAVIILAGLGYIVLDPALGFSLTASLVLLGAAAEATCLLGPSTALAVAATYSRSAGHCSSSAIGSRAIDRRSSRISPRYSWPRCS